jgi:hypothetical protein
VWGENGRVGMAYEQEMKDDCENGISETFIIGSELRDGIRFETDGECARGRGRYLLEKGRDEDGIDRKEYNSIGFVTE